MKRLAVIVIITLCATAIQAQSRWYLDTTGCHRTWIRTACLTYSSTPQVQAHANWIADRYDLAVNPPSAFNTWLRTQNPNMRTIAYGLSMSLRSTDSSSLATFLTDSSHYDSDSMSLWVDAGIDSIVTYSISPAGGDCGALIGGGPATTETNTSLSGAQLKVCGWNQLRVMPDVTYQGWQSYIAWKYAGVVDGSTHDGIMEDEVPCVGHPTYGVPATNFCFPLPYGKFFYGDPSNTLQWNDTLTRDEIRLEVLANNDAWVEDLNASLKDSGAVRLPNNTNYAVVGSDMIRQVIDHGSGAILFESYNRPSVGLWSTYCLNAIDSCLLIDTSYVIFWATIKEWDTTYFSGDTTAAGVTTSGLDRCQMERLCFYYLINEPLQTWFMLEGEDPYSANPKPANDYVYEDTLWNYFGAIEVDVGYPDSGYYTAKTDTDDKGQLARIRRRDYTRADGTDVIVLHRLHYTIYGSNTQGMEPYYLGGYYKPVDVDGNLGSPVDTAYMLFGDGQIFVEAGVLSPTPSLDSLHSDYSGESDSLQLTIITEVDTLASMLVYAWSGSGYPDSSGALRDSMAFSSNDTVYDTLTATINETGTLYLSAWAHDSTGDWSARAQTSLTLTGGAAPAAIPFRMKFSR